MDEVRGSIPLGSTSSTVLDVLGALDGLEGLGSAHPR